MLLQGGSQKILLITKEFIVYLIYLLFLLDHPVQRQNGFKKQLVATLVLNMSAQQIKFSQ